MSTTKTRSQDRPEWAERIRNVRGHRTQGEFAHLCCVSQMTISRWESGKDEPSADAYATLASISVAPHRDYFWKRSGFKDGTPEFHSASQDPAPRGPRSRWARIRASLLRAEASDGIIGRPIPHVRDSLLLGAERTPETKDVEILYLPHYLFNEWGELWAVTVENDSMSPAAPAGSLIIIDVATTDPSVLEGKVVALRGPKSIIYRRLKTISGIKLLISAYGSLTEAKYLLALADFKIVGSVVAWVGTNRFEVE